MKEEWRDIFGFEGYYQISNTGKVKSLERVSIQGHLINEKILNGFIKQNGYRSVDLYIDGKRSKFHIHRLVAEAFIPNLENKPCVDHINAIRDDNNVENLRWCTQKENLDNELCRSNMSKAHKGQIVSDETRMKFSKLFSGGGNPASQKVICDGIVYSCIKDFTNTIGRAYTTVQAWLNPNSKTKMPTEYVERGLAYFNEK